MVGACGPVVYIKEPKWSARPTNLAFSRLQRGARTPKQVDRVFCYPLCFHLLKTIRESMIYLNSTQAPSSIVLTHVQCTCKLYNNDRVVQSNIRLILFLEFLPESAKR